MALLKVHPRRHEPVVDELSLTMNGKCGDIRIDKEFPE